MCVRCNVVDGGSCARRDPHNSTNILSLLSFILSPIVQIVVFFTLHTYAASYFLRFQFHLSKCAWALRKTVRVCVCATVLLSQLLFSMAKWKWFNVTPDASYMFMCSSIAVGALVRLFLFRLISVVATVQLVDV